MDLEETARRGKRQTFMAAIGIALAVMILAPPIVQAAVSKVSITKSITLPVKGKIKVQDGEAVDSENYTTGPLFDGFGVLPNQAGQWPTRGIAVRTLAGGGGFFGAAACSNVPADATVTVQATDPGDVPNIVTGLIISAPSATPVTVTVTAPDVQATPIIALRTSAEEPTKSIFFGNGLTVSPSDLVFNCPAGAPVAGASFIVLGQ